MLNFEKLEVWQNARLFITDIYRMTEQFPESEKFGIVPQMRRAAISVASNIAEGSGRSSGREQKRFYEIAYASILEVYCQIIIAHDLDYISTESKNEIEKKTYAIIRQLSSLRNTLRD